MARQARGGMFGNRRTHGADRSKRAHGDARLAWEKAKNAFRH